MSGRFLPDLRADFDEKNAASCGTRTHARRACAKTCGSPGDESGNLYEEDGKKDTGRWAGK